MTSCDEGIQPKTKGAPAQPLFEDLLRAPLDPAKLAMRDRLIEVLNSDGEILPSANSPRGKLWHLVNSPDSSIDECAEIVRLDSSLAGRILRVANSAAYGSQASNVGEAVLRMGMKFLREQVFNAGIFKEYSDWELPPEWDLFWLRNIFVARMCERLAGRYGKTDGSEYLSGLIHDMGWLFVATYLPDEFAHMFAEGKPVEEIEAAVLPCSHAAISGAIAARSLLPARAVDAITYHHDPGLIRAGAKVQSDRSSYFLCLILNICDRVADNCGMDMFGKVTQTLEEIQEGPDVLWLKDFGAPPDLREAAEEELTKSKEIFDAYFTNRTAD